MRRILQGLGVAALIGWITVTGSAAMECSVCSTAESDSYSTKTVGQLARGAANTGLGWVELVRQPIKEVKGGGNVPIGIGKGIGHTLLRMGQGVGEMLTSPMPRAKEGKYTRIAQDCPLCVTGITTHK